MDYTIPDDVLNLPYWKQLLFVALESNDTFASILKSITQALDMTLLELATKSGIPKSTLYKISSSQADPRLSTIKKLILFIREEERSIFVGELFVAVITSRDVLDRFGHTITIDDTEIKIKEYLANTIEEEIILGVQAVKDGVKAIVCGPIAANTLRKIVDIPVVGISFSKESLIEAIEKAYPKI